MTQKGKEKRFQCVLKEKDKDGNSEVIECDGYFLDFIVHQFTGKTWLNYGLKQDEEDAIFTVPYDMVKYIKQKSGAKETLDKVRQMELQERERYAQIERSKNNKDPSLI